MTADLETVRSAATEIKGAVRAATTPAAVPSFGSAVQLHRSQADLAMTRAAAKAAIDCCARHGLTPIAAGGTRVVVDLGKVVAKIAWHPTWGQQANRNEARVWSLASAEVRHYLADVLDMASFGAVFIQRRADPLLVPGTAYAEKPVARSIHASELRKPVATLRRFGLVYDLGLKQWGRLDDGRPVCFDYPWMDPPAAQRLGIAAPPPNLVQV